MASRIENYVLSVIQEPGRSGGLPHLLRGFLGGCAGLYDAGLEFYLRAESLGLRRRTQLPISVLSIGNLSVGGTGKTPMTQWLCRRLMAHGIHVAVLSRGHGGTGTTVRVVSSGKGDMLAAAEAGDEPVLLAQTLPGVPVLIGKDRRLSGREAMRRFALDVLVLDDGFQYWQLARGLDIVLLDARRPFDNGYPLPRGLLREPKRHLRRAGAVVVTRADAVTDDGRIDLRTQISSLAPNVPLFFARHQAIGIVPAQDLGADIMPLAWLEGRRIVALCGIAQPQSFMQTLMQSGAQIQRRLVYDDHAVYDQHDVRRAAATLTETRADALVMTEKDAVKWPSGWDICTSYALRIEMQVENEQELMALALGRLSGRRPA